MTAIGSKIILDFPLPQMSLLGRPWAGLFAAAEAAASIIPLISSSQRPCHVPLELPGASGCKFEGSVAGMGRPIPHRLAHKPCLELLEDRTVLSPLVPGPTSLHGTEGQVYDGPVGTFTDGNTADTAANFTATIAWGDNTNSAGIVTGSAGKFTVSGQHTYAEEGNYPLGAVVTDNQGHSITLGGPPQWTQLAATLARDDLRLRSPRKGPVRCCRGPGRKDLRARRSSWVLREPLSDRRGGRL